MVVFTTGPCRPSITRPTKNTAGFRCTALCRRSQTDSERGAWQTNLRLMCHTIRFEQHQFSKAVDEDGMYAESRPSDVRSLGLLQDYQGAHLESSRRATSTRRAAEQGTRIPHSLNFLNPMTDGMCIVLKQYWSCHVVLFEHVRVEFD